MIARDANGKSVAIGDRAVILDAVSIPKGAIGYVHRIRHREGETDIRDRADGDVDKCQWMGWFKSNEFALTPACPIEEGTP